MRLYTTHFNFTIDLIFSPFEQCYGAYCKTEMQIFRFAYVIMHLLPFLVTPLFGWLAGWQRTMQVKISSIISVLVTFASYFMHLRWYFCPLVTIDVRILLQHLDKCHPMWTEMENKCKINDMFLQWGDLEKLNPSEIMPETDSILSTS